MADDEATVDLLWSEDWLDEGMEHDVDPDYWASTEGNAKRALCNLLALAQMRPDGVWDGD